MLGGAGRTWWRWGWLCEKVLSDAGGWAILGAFTPYFQAMSEEQLKAFMEAVKANEALEEEVNGAGDDTDAVVAIAKAAGFVISVEELGTPEKGNRNLDLIAAK